MADRARLSTPVMGTVVRMSEVARFCRTLSVLIGAGLPLQEIMQLMPQTTNTRVIRDAYNRMHQDLLMGQGLSGPMSHISLFPPLVIQMVTVGEESNSLGSTLGVVADFYEAEAEEKIAALVGLIMPVSTIGIALMVGFIAMSVVMPMYSITGSLE